MFLKKVCVLFLSIGVASGRAIGPEKKDQHNKQKDELEINPMAEAEKILKTDFVSSEFTEANAERYDRLAEQTNKHVSNFCEQNMGRMNELMKPNDTESHRARGMCYYMIGEYDSALADLEECTKIDSKDATCWFFMGEILSKTGKLNKARASYQKADLCFTRNNLALNWVEPRDIRGFKEMAQTEIGKLEELMKEKRIPIINYSEDPHINEQEVIKKE